MVHDRGNNSKHRCCSAVVGILRSQRKSDDDSKVCPLLDPEFDCIFNIKGEG